MNVDMDQETAKKLFVEGATMIFLGIPEGSFFGIDLDCWSTLETFRGFKMIPPGLHFVHYSGNSVGSGQTPRSSIMHFFSKKEFHVKMWDKTTEDMSKKELTDESILRLKDNLYNLDRNLAPYPYERWPVWKQLTSQITADLAKKLAPESGIIRSCVELLPMSDEERPRGVKSSSKSTDTSSTKSTATPSAKLMDTSSTKSTDTSSTKFSDISYTKFKDSNSSTSTDSYTKLIDSSSTKSTDTSSATFIDSSSTKSTDVSNTMTFDSSCTNSTNISSIKSTDTWSIISTDTSSKSIDASSTNLGGTSTMSIGTSSAMSIDAPSIDTEERSQSYSNRVKRITQKEREDAMLPKLKPVPGVSMRYTEVPRDKHPPGSTPSEITKHYLDQSYSLELMIAQYDEPLHLIGELQVAYLCFLVGHCLDSFEHWKDIFSLLCSCDAAIYKYRTVFFHFIRTIEIQINLIPPDFLEDIVGHNNLVHKKLRDFFRTAYASKVDGRLLTMIDRLREKLTKTLHWNFTGLDVDEEDERPVVVQLDEAELCSI